MAKSIIKKSLASNVNMLTTVSTVTGEITRNITVPSGKNLQFDMKKCGHIVSFKMWSDFDVAAQTVILTIPSKYLPMNLSSMYPPSMYLAERGANPSAGGTISIGQDGTVTCRVKMSGWQVFEAIWICS